MPDIALETLLQKIFSQKHFHQGSLKPFVIIYHQQFVWRWNLVFTIVQDISQWLEWVITGHTQRVPPSLSLPSLVTLSSYLFLMSPPPPTPPPPTRKGHPPPYLPHLHTSLDATGSSLRPPGAGGSRPRTPSLFDGWGHGDSCPSPGIPRWRAWAWACVFS